jgi:hypothetical protein
MPPIVNITQSEGRQVTNLIIGRTSTVSRSVSPSSPGQLESDVLDRGNGTDVTPVVRVAAP